MDFPRIREAPGELLERLRLIDPTAELLYWGPRRSMVEDQGRRVEVVVPVWLLGAVRPNGLVRRAGAYMLETQEKLGVRGSRDTWRMGRLYYQGFRPIAFYPTRDPSGAIFEDFRRRDWLLHHAFEAEAERALAEAEGIPHLEMRKQAAQAYVEGEGPSLWRFAFKHPVSVTVN